MIGSPLPPPPPLLLLLEFESSRRMKLQPAWSLCCSSSRSPIALAVLRRTWLVEADQDEHDSWLARFFSGEGGAEQEAPLTC